MCGMIDCSECFSWAPVAATYGVEQISVLKISLFKLFIIINFFSWIIYNPSDLRDISIQMVSQTTNWSAALLVLDAHLIFLASHLNTEGWKQPCFSREENAIWKGANKMIYQYLIGWFMGNEPTESLRKTELKFMGKHMWNRIMQTEAKGVTKTLN